MNTLYFCKNYYYTKDERILVGNPVDVQECCRMLNNYIELNYPNFKIYYTRISPDPDNPDNGVWIDYGSHINFFVCEGLKFKDFSENKEKM